jgi:MFS family permease
MPLMRRISDSNRAFGAVLRTPALRSVLLARGVSEISGWSYGVAIAVFAYDAGGAGAVGVALASRALPAALVAPVSGALADRFPRRRMMLASQGVAALMLVALTAASLANWPAAAVLVLAGFFSLAYTAYVPALAAFLPTLAKSPEQLTAANAVSSTVEGAGFFIGPAVAGVLLAIGSVEAVFAFSAIGFGLSCALIASIRGESRGGADLRGVAKVLGAAVSGFGTVGRDSKLRLLVGLIAAQVLVAGALSVLVVVMALELLDMGQPGVGYLEAAMGVGGVVGALATVGIVGGRRLAPSFVAGQLLWGIPIALIAVSPSQPLALVLLATVGLGNALADVSGFTLIQRAVADEVLGRVFGTLESLMIAATALGALLVPPLIELFGVRGALVATGAFLPMLVALGFRGLWNLDHLADAPVRPRQLLRRIQIFAPLPPAALEQLAGAMVSVQVAAGEDVVRQGDEGDRFYVIDDGEVEVLVDGRHVGYQHTGDHFGEVALVRDVPRTGTVRALSDTRLYALERDQFLGALTGHPASAEAADAVVGARLARARPALGAL